MFGCWSTTKSLACFMESYLKQCGRQRNHRKKFQIWLSKSKSPMWLTCFYVIKNFRSKVSYFYDFFHKLFLLWNDRNVKERELSFYWISILFCFITRLLASTNHYFSSILSPFFFSWEVLFYKERAEMVTKLRYWM